MRISRKVLLVYLLTLLPLVVLAGGLMSQWYSSNLQLVDADRLDNARLVSTAFETMVIDIGNASRAVGIATLEEPPERKTPPRMFFAARDFPLHWTAVTDTKGRVLYASDARLLGTVVTDTALSTATQGRQISVGTSRELFGDTGFVVAAPLIHPGTKLAGLGVSFVDPIELGERLAASRIEGGASIVDSNGRLVVSLEDPRLALAGLNWNEYTTVEAALAGQEAVDRDFTHPVTGKRRVVASVPVHAFGWASNSSTDYVPAMWPFIQAVAIASLAALLVLLVSGTVAGLTTRRILQSIRTLEVQAQVMARRDVPPPAPVHSGDELENVSRALNRTDSELRSYIAGIEALGDAGQSLASSIASRGIESAIIDSARQLFGARTLWLYRLDETGTLMLPVIWHSERGMSEPEPPLPGRGVTGAPLAPGQVELVSSVAELPHTPWLDTVLASGTHSLAEVALEFGGRPLGVLGLLSPGVEYWEAEGRQSQLLRAYAAQVATALENARLYENERSVADTLQQALLTLPETIPGISFDCAYHSASQAARVGGDFYDLFVMDDGRVGIVIGDVAGKGLEAAVMTSFVKNTVRAHADEPGKSPRDVVQLTNDLVEKESRPESFVTLFLAYFDPSDGTLVYCNAGHTAGAIMRPDGRVKRLPTNSPLTGAFVGLEFAETTTSLNRRDTLVLYTDGLIEARRDRELFGEVRLFELLSQLAGARPKEIVGELQDAVVSFTGGTLRDDLAILALTPTTAPAAPAQGRVGTGL